MLIFAMNSESSFELVADRSDVKHRGQSGLDAECQIIAKVTAVAARRVQIGKAQTVGITNWICRISRPEKPQRPLARIRRLAPPVAGKIIRIEVCGQIDSGGEYGCMLERKPVTPSVKEIVLENVPPGVGSVLSLGCTRVGQIRILMKVRELACQRVSIVEGIGRLRCEII